MIAMQRKLLTLTALLAGCATTADPNYILQLQAYQEAQRTQAAIAHARAEVETARYVALARIGETSEGEAKRLAVLALALAASNNASVIAAPAPLPVPPETDEQRAYKWAALF